MRQQPLTVQYDNQFKIISYDPLLVYIRGRLAERQIVHCLVTHHALTLLYQLQPNARLALYGHYNRRNQFIITKFMVGRPVQTLAS